MKAIEQLEQEKADILAKAIAVAAELRRIGGKVGMQPDKWELVESIEALKPEPERLRCFINVYVDGTRNHYASEDSANSVEDAFNVIARRAVPMIEVIPFEGEVPTWEGWEVYPSNPKAVRTRHISGNLTVARDQDEAKEFCDFHNAEMRRLQSCINQLLAERGEG